MSYDIQMYRKEVKEAQIASGNIEFFEKEENLMPFTAEQMETLKTRLSRCGFIVDGKRNGFITFSFNDESLNATALLSARGLYFNGSGEGIFEISMTSSELTDSGEFAKYDPQNEGWE